MEYLSPTLVGTWITPFENPQRWMGQNAFPILLLNDDNMIEEHQKTKMKMLYGCPFEKNEKEVFFQTNNFFFQEQKNFVQDTTFVQFFMYRKAKKISERSEKFFFENLKIYLAILQKKNFFKNFRITPKFFFAFQYIKN